MQGDRSSAAFVFVALFFWACVSSMAGTGVAAQVQQQSNITMTYLQGFAGFFSLQATPQAEQFTPIAVSNTWNAQTSQELPEKYVVVVQDNLGLPLAFFTDVNDPDNARPEFVADIADGAASAVYPQDTCYSTITASTITLSAIASQDTYTLVFQQFPPQLSQTTHQHAPTDVVIDSTDGLPFTSQPQDNTRWSLGCTDESDMITVAGYRPVEDYSVVFRFPSVGDGVPQPNLNGYRVRGVVTDLVMLSEDVVYLAGYTESSITPDFMNYGSTDAFVARMDLTTGELDWAVVLGTVGADQVHAITLDRNSGAIFVAGETSGDMSELVGTSTAAPADPAMLSGTAEATSHLFVAKISPRMPPTSAVITRVYEYSPTTDPSISASSANVVQASASGDEVWVGGFSAVNDMVRHRDTLLIVLSSRLEEVVVYTPDEPERAGFHDMIVGITWRTDAMGEVPVVVEYIAEITTASPRTYFTVSTMALSQPGPSPSTDDTPWYVHPYALYAYGGVGFILLVLLFACCFCGGAACCQCRPFQCCCCVCCLCCGSYDDDDDDDGAVASRRSNHNGTHLEAGKKASTMRKQKKKKEEDVDLIEVQMPRPSIPQMSSSTKGDSPATKAADDSFGFGEDEPENTKPSKNVAQMEESMMVSNPLYQPLEGAVSQSKTSTMPNLRRNVSDGGRSNMDVDELADQRTMRRRSSLSRPARVRRLSVSTASNTLSASQDESSTAVSNFQRDRNERLSKRRPSVGSLSRGPSTARGTGPATTMATTGDSATNAAYHSLDASSMMVRRKGSASTAYSTLSSDFGPLPEEDAPVSDARTPTASSVYHHLDVSTRSATSRRGTLTNSTPRPGNEPTATYDTLSADARTTPRSNSVSGTDARVLRLGRKESLKSTATEDTTISAAYDNRFYADEQD